MARNKRIIKVEVEKSEYTSMKDVIIKNMQDEVIGEISVFADGSIFIRKCRDVYINTVKIKTNKVEVGETPEDATFQHIEMNDFCNTYEINRKNRCKNES